MYDDIRVMLVYTEMAWPFGLGLQYLLNLSVVRTGSLSYTRPFTTYSSSYYEVLLLQLLITFPAHYYFFNSLSLLSLSALPIETSARLAASLCSSDKISFCLQHS